MFNESILKTIRQMIGPDEIYKHYDPEIIIHINSALADVTRFGIGPEEGLSISDESATWGQLIQDNKKLNNVVTYIYLSVKLVFDPPNNAALLASLQARHDKLEWCLEVASEE